MKHCYQSREGCRWHSCDSPELFYAWLKKERNAVLFVMPLARILLADDEVDITNVIRKGLEHVGFEVVVFNNPLEALSSFKAGQYDMLILDVRMEQMDGFTLYERIREIDRNVKVCFLTAFDVEYRDEFRSKFPSLDTKCFMKKPISIMTIIKMVKAELSLA